MPAAALVRSLRDSYPRLVDDETVSLDDRAAGFARAVHEQVIPHLPDGAAPEPVYDRLRPAYDVLRSFAESQAPVS